MAKDTAPAKFPTMQKFEYKSAVLNIEKKWFAMTSKDALGGVSQKSAALLAELGEDGWELVSVVKPSFWLGCKKSLVAFFKRAKA